MYNKVYIEITNICNMNCSFCHGHHRALRQMQTEEFSAILSKLTGYTKYLYYHLMGEPLTHPLLSSFIRLADAQGYKSIITTNGTLLHRHGRELIDAGVHKVNISLHSFENGSSEDHLQYIQQLANFANHAAVAGTIVNFRLWNKGCDFGKNEFALEHLKQALPGDWVPNTRGIRIRDKIFIEMDDRFEWPDKDAEIRQSNISCYGLRSQIGILVDGTVVPCCLDSEGIINLGNIFTEDLETILHSKRATDILHGFQCGNATEDLCKRCGFAQRFAR
jgi:MoaA/NifB/PqqE/SkfB family radical SAM enzyme